MQTYTLHLQIKAIHLGTTTMIGTNQAITEQENKELEQTKLTIETNGKKQMTKKETESSDKKAKRKGKGRQDKGEQN